ncbi:MAG: 4Fe-4S binding protein [Anaerolineae bacterium]
MATTYFIPNDHALPVHIDHALCTGCELCVHACPQHVLVMIQDITRIAGKVASVANPDLCTGCTQCEDACPDFCIRVLETVKV